MSLSDAYSATGAAWQDGPARIYDRLADVLLAESPVPLLGRLVADVGAGTGAASRAVERRGGRVVAVDLAMGMLELGRRRRPPAVVADGRWLPLASHSCGALVAAFSFNHVPDPDRALAEAARVVEPGGAVLVSAYADDDDHPAKRAVDAAVAEAGWRPDPWVNDLRATSIPVLATVGGAREAAARAGLDATAGVVEIPFPELAGEALVAWRMGMATVAPFIASLPGGRQRQLADRALELLGQPELLIRRIIVIVART